MRSSTTPAVESRQNLEGIQTIPFLFCSYIFLRRTSKTNQLRFIIPGFRRIFSAFESSNRYDAYSSPTPTRIANVRLPRAPFFFLLRQNHTDVIFQPMYYFLGHITKFARPGARRLKSHVTGVYEKGGGTIAGIQPGNCALRCFLVPFSCAPFCRLFVVLVVARASVCVFFSLDVWFCWS